MSVFTVIYHAKKSAQKLGAKNLATAVEAEDEKLAASKADVLLSEQRPGERILYFKPKVVADAPGMDRPALNIIDDSFMDNRIWNENLKIIETTGISDNDNEINDDFGAVDDDGDADSVNSNAPQSDEAVNYDALPPEYKLSVMVKYGTPEIKKSQLADATDLMQDGASTFDGHIVEALNKTPSVAHMYPERINELITAIRSEMRETDKWPTIANFASNWIANLQERRKAEKTSDDVLRTSTGAIAGGNTVTDRGTEITHDFETLKLEAALAILGRAMDYDIYKIPTSIVNRAREMVQKNQHPFSEIYAVLKEMPGILDFSRAMIIYSIKNMPDEIYETASKPKFLTYFISTLKEAGHARPDPHIVAGACGMLPVDTNGALPDEKTEQNAPGQTDVLEQKQIENDAVAAPAANDDECSRAVEAAPYVESLGGGKFTLAEEPQYKKSHELKDGFNDLVRLATEHYGVIGSGWGYEILDEKITPTKNIIKINLWYKDELDTCKFIAYGTASNINEALNDAIKNALFILFTSLAAYNG